MGLREDFNSLSQDARPGPTHGVHDAAIKIAHQLSDGDCCSRYRLQDKFEIGKTTAFGAVDYLASRDVHVLYDRSGGQSCWFLDLDPDRADPSDVAMLDDLVERGRLLPGEWLLARLALISDRPPKGRRHGNPDVGPAVYDPERRDGLSTELPDAAEIRRIKRRVLPGTR